MLKDYAIAELKTYRDPRSRKLLDKETLMKVDFCLNHLTGLGREILTLYYKHGEPHAQIAIDLYISLTQLYRVRQLALEDYTRLRTIVDDFYKLVK